MIYPRTTRVEVNQETGRPETIVYVRGRVSKKHNPPGVWLRLTQEYRLARDTKWRATEKGKAYRARENARRRDNPRMKDWTAAWEKANVKRRRSPRRYLFRKMRKAGVPIDQARKVSGWRAHAIQV